MVERVDFFGIGAFAAGMSVAAWSVAEGGGDGRTVLFATGLVVAVYGLLIARSILHKLREIELRADAVAAALASRQALEDGRHASPPPAG